MLKNGTLCSGALEENAMSCMEAMHGHADWHAMCRVLDEDGFASEDTFCVTAEERVSLKMHNKNVPYVTRGVRFLSLCDKVPPSGRRKSKLA